MTTTYSALLNASQALTEEMGQPAAASLFTELSMTLQQQPYQRRVLVAATRE